MNRRRDLLVLAGAGAISPRAVLAQAKQPVLIASLNASSRQLQSHVLAAFREELTALGWKEGVNFVLGQRWADGRYERLQPLAEELAAGKPAVIVANPSAAVAAAAKAAPTIPIVIAGGDPLSAKLVPNLARPGGMLTGVTNMVNQISTKHLELLLDAVPRLQRIGFLRDGSPGDDLMAETTRRAAAQRSVEIRFAEVVSPADIEQAVARLAKEGAQALILRPSPLFLTERQRIAKLAAAQRWPWVAGQHEYVEAGALFSYGADRTALYRRAAHYVDRILKGAKPGDLPIEQPTRFELVINMRTAKALGLTIPQPFLMRADRVIE